jgi:phospholipid/cholesterol/gamma-HCH transport system substrate-binding protein
MNRYLHETAVGIIVMGGLLCVGYMTVKLCKISYFGGGDTYVLHARFTSVSGLKVGDPVEMFGIQIEQVEYFKIDQRDKWLS